MSVCVFMDLLIGSVEVYFLKLTIMFNMFWTFISFLFTVSSFRQKVVQMDPQSTKRSSYILVDVLTNPKSVKRHFDFHTTKKPKRVVLL